MSTAAGSGDRAAAVGPGGGVPADVAAAAAEQDLGPELAHLAWEIACLAGAEAARRPLLLTALAVLAAERAGSTRLRADAATLDDSLRALAATAEDVAGVTALLAAAQAGDPATRRLLGGPGDYRPLLLAGGHLYTQRSWQLEQSVGKRLR